MPALRALRGRQAQVETRVLGHRQPQHFLCLTLPLALQHDRQAIHHHIEKTAHQQPEHRRQDDEVSRLHCQEVP
ncbi:hypothetical protein D3C81_2055890 [compost metagenome]